MSVTALAWRIVSPRRTSVKRAVADGHGILIDTLVGTGIGLGMFATGDCRRSSDYTCTALAAFFGGTGAGLGALGGAIVSIFLR